MRKVVGVSDLKVSANPREEIITHALGSCLGITVYDPVVKVGGMVHVMLPMAKSDPEKAKNRPAMYVDTGFGKLLKEVYELGAQKKNLEIIVAGGASMKKNQDDDYFKIGKRNFTVLRKLLWKNGFMITSQDVGGSTSRTMVLSIADGLVTVNKQPINNVNRTTGISVGAAFNHQVAI
jgi:chemotaxis protein CheD